MTANDGAVCFVRKASDIPTCRWGLPRDAVALGAVMFDAVRHGPSRYTHSQRMAWVPAPRRGADWSARLAPQRIRVAEVYGRIVGFMSLLPADYIDFAYIRPGWRGGGLFRRLSTDIEREALRQGAKSLHTHASMMACPAFRAVGFRIVRDETIPLRGEMFRRYEMTKPLTRRC